MVQNNIRKQTNIREKLSCTKSAKFLKGLQKNKSAQVTVFVILAIAIVAIIIILFLPQVQNVFVITSPDVEVGTCMQEAVEEAIEIVLPQGGIIDPMLYYAYQGDKIEYLCYTNEYFKTGVMQKPLFKQSVEREIEAYAQPRVDQCVADMKDNLKSKGYVLEEKGTGKLEVSIIPKNVLLFLDLELTTTRDSETHTFKNLGTDFKTEIYDLINYAASIANWEATYGDSSPELHMAYNHNLQIEKKKQGDGTTIYIITDLTTEDKIQFASRSLAWPAGYSG